MLHVLHGGELSATTLTPHFFEQSKKLKMTMKSLSGGSTPHAVLHGGELSATTLTPHFFER